MKGFEKLILIAAIIIAIAQMIGTFRYFGSEIVKVWRTAGKSAVWRGVNFSASNDFADFVEFLVTTIPPDATIVLPPAGVGRRALWQTPYMQFFLLPRHVINCTSSDEDCPADLARSGAYILMVGEDQFPGTAITSDPARRSMFNDNWGVYLPGMPGEVHGVLPYEFSSLLEIFLTTLWSFLWVAALTLGGWGIVTALAPHLWLPSRLALGFGLAVGFFSFVLYLLMWLGRQLSPAILLGLTGIWVAAGVLAVIPGRRSASRPWLKDRISWIYLAACAVLAGLAVILAVGKGYYASDEIVLWGIKGYGIASLGLTAGISDLGTRTANYPLNIPLLIAVFRTLFGDTLPQSKLLFPLYYISLLVVILDFLRSRLEPHLAGWLTLAYASVPLIYYHATIAYANLPLTFYLAGGVILAINKLSLRSDRPVAPGDREQGASELGEWVLSGCFFALAAWTRPEGLVISIMCWTFLAGVLFVRQRKIVKLSQLLSKLAAFSVPLLIVSGFWLASSGDVYRKPGWSQEVIRSGVAQALSGTLQFEQMSIVMRRFLSGFFDLQTWGVLGISIIVLLLFVPIITRRGRPDWIIAGPALIAIVLILGMYLILAQDLNHGADWWVNTGLSRMLLPGMTLLWLGLVAQVQIPATAAQT